jgi:hypothetical protein
MNSLLRRVVKLEPEPKERPLRIMWNDYTEASRAEAASLRAQGFKVMLVGWAGRNGRP